MTKKKREKTNSESIIIPIFSESKGWFFRLVSLNKQGKRINLDGAFLWVCDEKEIILKKIVIQSAKYIFAQLKFTQQAKGIHLLPTKSAQIKKINKKEKNKDAKDDERDLFVISGRSSHD